MKDAYLKLAATLADTIEDLGKGSGADVAPTIAWAARDVTSVAEEVQRTAKELLMIGMLLKELYGRALTKAHLEFVHRPYNQAFEALKKYRVKQKLKSAKRKAGLSEENRKLACSLLEEDKKLFIEVTENWEEQCRSWESKGVGMGQGIHQQQRGFIDKVLGVDRLERVLPKVVDAAAHSIRELLEFIPGIKELEDGLTNYTQEAEEITDRLDREYDKIGESLEPKLDIEDTITAWEMSTPTRRKVTFEEEVRRSVLFHDNISLSRALGRLRSAMEKAEADSTEASRELLKARAETASRRKAEMKLNAGTDEEVREAYTTMEELDEVLIKAMAFINLEERKEQRRREDERTKGIMAAKSTPATKVPPFSGRREDFWEWLFQFVAAVPVTLPEEMRAGQLRQAIRDPGTQEMIKGCQTYEDLEDELRRHFGSKQDELNRLIAQLDLIPRPKNKNDECTNFETLRKIYRKLKVINEQHVLDRLKLGRISVDSFLPRTREELILKLQERKQEICQEYSIVWGIGQEEARNLALRGEVQTLAVPNEEYCAIFWDFLESRADIARAMKAQTNITGQLGGGPRQEANFRSNRIEPTEGNGVGPTRKCAFANCQGTDHFTSRCDKNLRPGDVPSDIIQVCQDSQVCVRCLRSWRMNNHNETCIGAYKRRSDQTWVKTDCKSGCELTLASGRKVNLNRRICHHATNRYNQPTNPGKADGAAANVNRLQVVDEDSWEYEVPSAAIYASNATPISNRLMVNDLNCGEASQLVEWLEVGANGVGYSVLAMYDLGTSCSVVDTSLARRCGFKSVKAKFTISTVAGAQTGSDLYTFYIKNSKGTKVKIQALGVDIRQHYPMTKIKVKGAWREYFKGQSHQRAEEGYLGLLLGSDHSKNHPRQISFSSVNNEVLWRSELTGRYLISGARNEAAKCHGPTMNKIAVSPSREGPRKANLSAKVVTSRVHDGKVITLVEDMKEKVFRQLTSPDAVLVTPCTACATCRADTDRMAEQDLLEFDALSSTVSFDQELKRYRGDFLYLEDQMGRIKSNSAFAKANSEKLHKRLRKLPVDLVKDFDDALEKAKEMGALKRTSEVEGVNSGYPKRHIPINFAFSGKESSTRTRPTFNCGWSGGGDDLSFNDLHITGPRNLNNLDASMLFFKVNPVVGLIDVKKFFWTCQVSVRTASLNRIWLPKGGYSKAREGELEMEEWCWTTLTFGQAGAPALSGVIRHRAADDFCKIEEVKVQVKEKALVDDILIGASTKEEFEAYQRDVEQMLEKSGMKHHDWVVSGIKSDHIVDFDQQPLKEGTKIFGYQYEQELDQFSLRININLATAVRGKKFGESLQPGDDPMSYLTQCGFTKRKALGFTLSLWDLTGWVLPIQMLLRLQYRELLEDHPKLNWDEELTEAYKIKYARLFKRLLAFQGLTWDRAVVPTSNWDEKWGCRLATFFDGSEVASAAYTYIVTRRIDGSFHSRLLWAKGKLGCGSVPRNELGAAFLAVKINTFLERQLQIKIRDITYFGDSQAVLYQIASRSVLYDAWARARLRSIQQGSRGSNWLYVPAGKMWRI